MEVEAVFRYPLAPFVTFAQGGEVSADVRDNGRRAARELIALQNGEFKLALRVDRACDGKKPRLVFSQGGKDLAIAAAGGPLPQTWTAVKLRWDGASKAEAELPGGETVSIALPRPFEPKSVALQTAAVDELKISGQGSFLLDWSHDYGALVTPRPGGNDVAIELFGFDAYFVSTSREKRDFPMVRLLNGGAATQVRTVRFSLRGELSGTVADWTQKIRVPAGEAVWKAVHFPSPLADDVYHLSASSGEWSGVKHFVSVQDRAGEPRVPKFGLHDSNRVMFGFWPDALPIDLCHVYLRFAYVRGPAWDRDPGVKPETPPDEWNWNPLLDSAIRQGLTPYVSLCSIPDSDWMRAKEYEKSKMKIFSWGKIGGVADTARYRAFLLEVARRYQGKVPFYEVENEPNAYLGGFVPADYAAISQTTAKAIHEADPAAKVYGICGTGSFVPWMTDVFKAGGAEGIDGVAIHTYVSPRMPEEALLPKKLEEIKGAIHEETGHALPLINSETGTYVALREQVDRPIAPEKLEQLIQAGTPNLFVSRWPNRAIDERSGSISVVQSAVFNFLAGADYYTFFGWNPEWPSPDWWTKPGEACFAIISATKEGERTPSWHTLAIGVLTEQLRAALQNQGRPIQDNGVSGGVFPKLNGGEVAVLWSAQGKRSILVESPAEELEAVSLFGKKTRIKGANGSKVVRLELDAEPVYLHAPQAGLKLLPSPVIAVGEDSGGIRFTLVNRSNQPWEGSVAFSAPGGWTLTPGQIPFSLQPNTRSTARVEYTYPEGTPKGAYRIEGSLRLRDGTPLTFPALVNVRPSLTIPRVAPGFDWKTPAAWEPVQPVHRIDRPEQVTVGRAPLLASLQEEKFWGGPKELSARSRFATDGANLFVQVEVTDAFFHTPATWPGVHGSSLELFLDQRASRDGLGSAAYGPGVSQLLLKPAAGTQGVEIAQASEQFGTLQGLTAVGGTLPSGNYWIAVRIPRLNPDSTLGIDVGINGPTRDGSSRKSQLILFGSAQNGTNASAFGKAVIPPANR